MYLVLIFKGIIHIVTIPILTQIITEKIPLIGRFISGLIKWILTAITNRMKFDEIDFEEDRNPTTGKSSLLESLSYLISDLSEVITTVVNFIFNTLLVPMIIALIIALFILVIYIDLIN